MADNKTPTEDPNTTDPSSSYDDANTDNSGGITNRSYEEERENQEALPPRGASRDESRNMGVGDEVEADRDERQSER